jgi:hypothetical protein
MLRQGVHAVLYPYSCSVEQGLGDLGKAEFTLMSLGQTRWEALPQARLGALPGCRLHRSLKPS